jgi:diguanylate cyclase (GGDEF)-like protein
MTLRRRLPAGLLARTRLGAVVIASIAIAMQLAQIGNISKPRGYDPYSAAAILLLIAIVLGTYVSGRSTWWDVVTLPVLVVAGAADLVDPLAAIALALSVTLVLSLYGSTWMWVWRSLGAVIAVPLSAAVSPVSMDRPMAWNSVTVLGLIPQIMLVTVMMRGIFAALVRQERASAREAALARSGRDMLGLTEVAAVFERARQAAEQLISFSPGTVLLVLRRTASGLRVSSVAGLPDRLGGTPVPASVIGAPEWLSTLVPGIRRWRTESLDDDLHIVVGGARTLPDDVFDAFRNLSNQLVLAEARCRANAELDRQANHDHLTQLPNRAKFFGRLAAEVDVRAPGTVALLNIDLDDFKQVNDRYGHAAGDELLVHVAARIAELGGSGGIAARFGGDEFALLLTELDDSGDAGQVAARTAELLCARLVAPIHLHDTTVTVGASIGVAVTMPGLTAGDLMRNADIAMYSAKARGKNRVEIFHPDQHGHAAEHRTREKHLGTAVERDEILIGYRPQLDPTTGGLAAIETHASWHHPLFGVLAAGELLALAGRTGNLASLGRYLLRRTFAEIAKLPDHEARFTVDVSGRQLRDPAYADLVLDALAEAGLDPARLELEITGADPLGPAEGADSLAARQLARLADRGVRIALDATHTRWAAPAMLRTYRIDRLTVDAADGTAVDLARSVGRVLGTRLVMRGVADAARDAGPADAVPGDGPTAELSLADMAAWLAPARAQPASRSTAPLARG